MKQEYFRIALLILAVIATISFFLQALNGTYTIINATIPKGAREDADGSLHMRPVETIVRVNTRTGEAEYYSDLTYPDLTPSGRAGSLWHIDRGWRPLINQKIDADLAHKN